MCVDENFRLRVCFAVVLLSFRHALIRSAAYESVLKSTLPQYHLGMAEALIELAPEVAESVPALVAHHLRKGRQPERAAALKVEAREMPSWALGPRQLADLELLMGGGFSPLAGFMGRGDYEAVLGGLRLADSGGRP